MNISANHNSLGKPIKTSTISRQKSPPNNRNSTLSLLQICQNVQELMQVHSLLIKTSLIHQNHAFGRLLLSLSSSKEPNALDYAKKLFDTIEFPRTSFIYNTMIRAYLNSYNPKEGFVIYLRMLSENSFYADEFTFTFVFSACSKSSAVFEGKQAHAQFVKYPFRFGTNSWNSLMDFYVKIGERGLAVRKLFDEIKRPDIVSWNCLLDGYVKAEELDNARSVFDEMPMRDTVSWTIMLVGYANAGLLPEARCLFDDMPERNVVSWSAMIGGYISIGSFKEALDLFKEMQVAKVMMDKIVVTLVLSACASLGALDQGCWIHAYIEKHRIQVDAHLATALVDMYCKCGRVDLALSIFRKSQAKKVFLWNAVLGGLAMHSRGKEAVELFSEMLDGGTKPNEITFICVISACSHSGLVGDGLQVFNNMMKDCNVTPTVEHYACVVDLLGRGGLLNDAKQIIETMPMEADGRVWRPLLGACRIYGDVELAEEVGRILIDLEPLNDGNYVLLSNIFANDSRWEDVGKLRRAMKARGVNKTPGCSSIELNGVVHDFFAGDHSHHQSLELHKLLDELSYYWSRDEENCLLQVD